jgi:hypothetical protein
MTTESVLVLCNSLHTQDWKTEDNIEINCIFIISMHFQFMLLYDNYQFKTNGKNPQ